MKNKLVFFPTQQFYNAILDLTHDCLLLVDVKTKLIVYANKACSYLYGYTPEQLVGLPISVINITGDQIIQQKMSKVMQCYPETYRFESLHARKDGHTLNVEVISRMVEINTRKYFLSHITNITKQKQMQLQIQGLIRQLSSQAYYDYLTQAYNRTYLFNNYLRRITNRNIGIILLDINKFKIINDTYGHQAGDFILVEITKYIRLDIHKSGKLIRYGGDELLIVLVDTHLEELAKVAEQIETGIASKEFVFNKHKILCSVSSGIASDFVLNTKDFEDLIKKADHALYVKKKQGVVST
ncbi:sensor domain-containing diguanylate cyclase [Sporomusa malonica]|uniref:PAS domain S-box-containing protein/diguanylate cyclase (GGDEF) domain-containing protein n=1 Tax=Sporomusa malonica TaxID=112901 RepID=A0A1W2F0M6_9FIRM|nr:sensor domain-containing diguanylate cyclase [Sporomusa malonica]SMD15527.1 PAS domain S-box-containing protein/diguanylate cyclase (GGDEF) domain-containing protein [Sporomusa malonica]